MGRNADSIGGFSRLFYTQRRMLNNQFDNHEMNAVGHRRRPYVGVLFECCGIYVRIYRRPGQMFYLGRCPKCLRTVRLRVGRDGTAARFFRAT